MEVEHSVLKTTSLLFYENRQTFREESGYNCTIYQSFWTFLPKALLFSVQGALCLGSPFHPTCDILLILLLWTSPIKLSSFLYLHTLFCLTLLHLLSVSECCCSLEIPPLSWTCNTQEEKPEGAHPPPILILTAAEVSAVQSL